jgi:hypothetical protein
MPREAARPRQEFSKVFPEPHECPSPRRRVLLVTAVAVVVSAVSVTLFLSLRVPPAKSERWVPVRERAIFYFIAYRVTEQATKSGSYPNSVRPFMEDFQRELSKLGVRDLVYLGDCIDGPPPPGVGQPRLAILCGTIASRDRHRALKLLAYEDAGVDALDEAQVRGYLREVTQAITDGTIARVRPRYSERLQAALYEP